MVSGSAQTVADAAATPTVGSIWATHRWSILRWSSPVLLVVLWQLFSATGLIPGDVLPAPQLIFDAGLQLIQNGKLVEALEDRARASSRACCSAASSGSPWVRRRAVAVG